MNNKKNNGELDAIEKQIEEIEEWNKNANNPGYYVTSSKVPLPMKKLSKYPLVILSIGIVVLIPSLYNIINGFSFYNILSNAIQLILGSALCYGGIVRLIRYKD